MRTIQRLSESEMEIMQAIWQAEPPVTSAYLMEVFVRKGSTSQTMSTFLTRLVDKGLLTVARRGKTNFYTPAMTESGYRQREARQLVEELYHGSVLDFLAAFYGGGQLKPQELAQLQAWFEQEAGHD